VVRADRHSDVVRGLYQRVGGPQRNVVRLGSGPRAQSPLGEHLRADRSSATLELARRSLRTGAAKEFIRWLSVTLVLGLGFLSGQLIAWRELASRGVYLASNPGSSFFYVLTAAHGIHLLGGVVALGYVVLRARRIAFGEVRRTPLEVTAIYWHFMDALWIYLFFVLLNWM